MRKTTKATTGLTAALIYTRVSTEEQADDETLAALGKKKASTDDNRKKNRRNGQSLPTQLAEARRYVTYHPDWVMHEDYTDVMSGKRADRPQYQKLVADAKALQAQGRKVVLVVAALDRLGRNVKERVACWEALNSIGVEFHSVREGGLQQEWMYNLLAGLAQEETRRLGERVGKVRSHLRDAGWKPSGRAALGYRWRPATADEQQAGAPSSVLEPDPATAATVREAFERSAGGEGVRAVARWVASLPSELRGGHVMNFGGVRGLLSAPVYVARSDEGDDDILQRPVGRWERLISDETFAAVQARIAGHRQVPVQATGRYLLSGLLYCPICSERMCGSNMPSGKLSKDGTRRRYAKYRCERRTSGAKAGYDGPLNCAASVRMEVLDAAVVEAVEPLIALASGDQTLRNALRRVWKGMQKEAAPDPGVRSRIAQAERAADKARARLRSAGIKFADDEMTKTDYHDLRDALQEDLKGAQEEIERLRADRPATAAIPDIEVVLTELDDWAAAWRSEDVPQRRDVLRALIERIVPERIGFGRYKVDVKWTVAGLALQQAAEVRSTAVA